MIHLLCARLRRRQVRASRRGGKRINLALQGGGAHGAFTWGVLDHLLDDGRLAVRAFPAPRPAPSMQ